MGVEGRMTNWRRFSLGIGKSSQRTSWSNLKGSDHWAGTSNRNTSTRPWRTINSRIDRGGPGILIAIDDQNLSPFGLRLIRRQMDAERGLRIIHCSSLPPGVPIRTSAVLRPERQPGDAMRFGPSPRAWRPAGRFRPGSFSVRRRATESREASRHPQGMLGSRPSSENCWRPLTGPVRKR